MYRLSCWLLNKKDLRAVMIGLVRFCYRSRSFCWLMLLKMKLKIRRTSFGPGRLGHRSNHSDLSWSMLTAGHAGINLALMLALLFAISQLRYRLLNTDKTFWKNSFYGFDRVDCHGIPGGCPECLG